MAGIPVVDFSQWHDPRTRRHFVTALGEGLEEFGFVSVLNSGVQPQLVHECYEAAEALFALDEATKRAYETPADGRQRGYTSFGIEHAKDQRIPDLKEFWHVGRELSADHPFRQSGEVPPNLLPTELPHFHRTFAALFAAQDTFMGGLLEALASYLELPQGLFTEAIRDGNSVLRAIHYPPLGPDAPEGAVRAAQHEDINLMTSLPVSTAAGLELLTRDGTWMAIEPPENVMVCDTGDMMQLFTEGRIPATTHRVVNPPGPLSQRSRYSMPFFCHPHPEFVLKPAHGEDAPITARDFLRRRLVEIGVA